MAQAEAGGWDADDARNFCSTSEQIFSAYGCDDCLSEMVDTLGFPGGLTGDNCACGLHDAGITECTGATAADDIEAIRAECYSVCEDYDVWY